MNQQQEELIKTKAYSVISAYIKGLSAPGNQSALKDVIFVYEIPYKMVYFPHDYSRSQFDGARHLPLILTTWIPDPRDDEEEPGLCSEYKNCSWLSQYINVRFKAYKVVTRHELLAALLPPRQQEIEGESLEVAVTPVVKQPFMPRVLTEKTLTKSQLLEVNAKTDSLINTIRTMRHKYPGCEHTDAWQKLLKELNFASS